MSATVDPEPLPKEGKVAAPLSALIDRIGQGMERDEGLVHHVARWWAERREHIGLEVVERFRARDVVVTFRMDGVVSLVITAHTDDPPAALTVEVDESHFPKVAVLLHAEPVAEPVSVATLDYSVRGREFVMTQPHDGASRGDTGEAICLMTIDAAVLLRGRLRSGRRLQVPQEVFELGP